MDLLVFIQLLTWIFLVPTVVYYLHRYGTSPFNYFSDQGIPGPKPIPFLGNSWGIWKKNLPKYDVELVKKYGKVFGCFDGLKPNLWTTDVELIKSIFIKDFNYFRPFREIQYQSRVRRNFIKLIRDDEWEDIRSSINPAFTSDKVALYTMLIKDSVDRFVLKLQNIAESEGQFEANRIFGSFSLELVARCAFGVKTKKLHRIQDPVFIQKVRRVFTSKATTSPIMMLGVLFPQGLSYLGDRIFHTNDYRFFINLMTKLVEKRRRQADKKKYHDFPEIAAESIMEFTKVVNGKTMPLWTPREVDEIVIAVSTVFLLAGCRTTTTTLSSCCFLLARHPDVQEKLYSEIMSKIKKHEVVNHELITELTYLDQFIHEVLRIYPPVARLERECTKDVTYKGIHIEKGTFVTVPIFALHYSEEYYSNPYTFNPDRWSVQNKKKMSPGAFMAFGMGPRNCIGLRLVMEELKMTLCTLVMQFKFFKTEDTEDEIKFENGFLTVVQPENINIGVCKRFNHV